MPSVRFPSNSLRKTEHGKRKGLCHLLFRRLSHKPRKPTNQLEQESHSDWKLLWKTVLCFQIYSVSPWRRVLFFQSIPIKPDQSPGFSQSNVRSDTCPRLRRRVWELAPYSPALVPLPRDQKHLRQRPPHQRGSLTAQSRGPGSLINTQCGPPTDPVVASAEM